MIIEGASALAYWRTPPVVREVNLDAACLTAPPPRGAGYDPAWFASRRQAGEHLASVRSRLAGDFKGIPLPVRVLVEPDESDYQNSLLVRLRRPASITRAMAEDVGGGVFVASVPLLLVQMAARESLVATCALMYEFCGLYSLFRPTPAARLVLDEWMRSGAGKAPYAGSYAFCEEDGSRAAAIDDDGMPISWAPCLSQSGAITDLWRRPPLVLANELRNAFGTMRRLHGLPRARMASRYVCDGSGSPLETKMVMLLCLPPEIGGEGWEFPLLNQRIVLTSPARSLAGMGSCVADCMWRGKKVDLEINGAAYHSDEWGFARASGRRAALQAMGYSVVEVTSDMMCHEDAFDALVHTLAELLDFPLQARSRMFVEARRSLMYELFAKLDRGDSAL